jgi:VCBS repeat-containing protein
LTVAGSDGSLTGFATVTVEVTNINDNTPLAVADSYTGFEDMTLVVGTVSGVLVNDTDGDGDALSASGDTLPATGSLSLTADGSFVYDPDPETCGEDSFTYHAFDGTSSSAPVIVTIHVVCSNDIPVVDDASGSVAEDAITGTVVVVIS